MIVIMIAITPSLNASNRPLLIDAHHSRCRLHHRHNEEPCLCSPSLVSLHAPVFAFHNHAVRFDRLCGRPSQYCAGANVELTSVPWTRHGRSIQGAFVQRTSPMCTFSLRGTETARNIEYRRVTDQQRRTGRHRIDTKLVVFENL